MRNDVINAIENVLHKRMLRGTNYVNLIQWLDHLKTVWKYDIKTLDDFIDAIKQKPLI